MRILVAGAGGVGGTVAGALARAGVPFVLMEKDAGSLDAMGEGGLELIEGGASRRLEVTAVSPARLEGSFDAVFLAVKGPRLGEVMRAASPHMHRDTFFVPLQAGWAVDLLAEMVEEKRVLPGLAEFHARRSGPGRVEMISSGTLVVGELDGRETPRLAELRELFSGGVPGFLRVSANIAGRAWWTMRLSACLGPLGALAGSDLGGEEVPEGLWKAVAPLWDELEDLARLEGVELEPALPEDNPGPLLRAAAPYAASLLEDLDRGEPLERDLTAGFLLRRAERLGAGTPALSSLHSLLREAEAGRRAPSPAALREFSRRLEEERGLSLM